ncbi:hypothetical protein H6P81_012857 [Aristolochia fimbriata]|uniref:Signal recognition particle subunit SRP72 n=1 Tax=Aristolochia fimbriata TaxID=158543 RepID=A0AAV7EDL3_ARIFI|nr:hypothetical protein H6P81_012857 [Aristolochia fimbriata]
MAPKMKEKPKTPVASSVPLEDLFASLDRHLQNFDYDQVVKVADQVLSNAPGDEDALRCKVVALIKGDKIDRAVSIIQASERLPIDLRFYKAYCLYRQNKLSEALQCLEGQERTTSVLQLESQILYRLGKMESCLENYEKLQKFKMDNSLELKTNIIAALILAGRASEVQGMLDSMKVKATSSFELAYNTACSLIEKRNYADAEQLLLSARRIGQEMLMEDDYADDEIESELAPIAVQLAYVKQLMGHQEEASEAYSEIINRNLADPSSLAIATNDLIALKGAKDIADGLRKLDRFIEKPGGLQSFKLSNGLDYKLSSRQKEAIYANRLLLLLHTNRLKEAKDLALELGNMFPESVMRVLLQAAVFVREGNPTKAEDILHQCAEKYPKNFEQLYLVQAQVAATAGHSQIAAESLSKLSQIQHTPATVATLVALRERCGDSISAAAVLDSALNWWSNSMSEEKNKINLIMHQAASFKLKHGQQEEAARLYEELVKSHGNILALVGLVTTAANVDVNKAESYEKRLKPLQGLKDINVESLEKTSGAKHFEGAHIANPVDAVQEEGRKEKARKKRKRKPRYPKGFDPANPGPPPDPERWLPRRERSSYRPKRKDKRAAQVRGSQGAVVREKHEANTSTANTSSSSVKTTQATSGSSKPTADQTKAPSAKSRKKKSRH